MMKKTLTSFFTLAIGMATLLILPTTNFSEAAEKEKQVISLDASYVKFESLEQLEDMSPVIVEVKFKGDQDRTVQNWEEEGEIVATASKTKVEIKKVHKGDLKKGDSIYIYEPGYFPDDDTYKTIEGYNVLNVKGKYILFLRPYSNDGEYVIVGGHQGKYNLNNTKNSESKLMKSMKYSELLEGIDYSELEEIDYFGDEPDDFNKIKKEVKKKFN